MQASQDKSLNPTKVHVSLSKKASLLYRVTSRATRDTRETLSGNTHTQKKKIGRLKKLLNFIRPNIDR